MSLLTKSSYVFAILDIVFVAFITCLSFSQITQTFGNLFLITLIFVLSIFFVLSCKGFYKPRIYKFKDIYLLFEGIFVASFIACLLSIPLLKGFAPFLTIIDAVFIFALSVLARCFYLLYKKIFHPIKNVLIVGAGQDGKLIANEISARPELGMKVVGFLDDNMNSIEEEDATIPILGLTYDSEAVIKDNNIDIIIIAVKSRMDSNILTDLVMGIPIGVKVWRMPTFYASITNKLYVSKMTVNWLFYDYVKLKHVLYSHIKRILDKLAAIAILIITLPLTLVVILGIKISDFGAIFYTQTRIGKFGKPFKMLKFRTMYQDKVDAEFDDDLMELDNSDKRIIPFCRWIRNFHIDDIPQMINVLKGEMSIVGPRPIREDVYYQNKESIAFWECRNWVRPGLTGWQQIHINNPTPEERLAYDLYYIKNRKLCWDISIFFQYVIKILIGKCK